jgi:hypothetical protein
MAMEKSSKKTCGKAEENPLGKKQKTGEVRVVESKKTCHGVRCLGENIKARGSRFNGHLRVF